MHTYKEKHEWFIFRMVLHVHVLNAQSCIYCKAKIKCKGVARKLLKNPVKECKVSMNCQCGRWHKELFTSHYIFRIVCLG